SVDLGQTHLEAAGNLKNGADFHGSLPLDEIGQLLQLAEQPSGVVKVAGKANLNDSGYLVTGRVDARNVAFHEGTSRFTGIGLSSSVQADPKTITLNGLKLFAFGGELTADGRIDELTAFALKGHLQGFDIQNLTAALLAKRAGYSGT